MKVFKNKKNINENNSAISSITGAYFADNNTKNLQEATKRVLEDSDELVKVIKQYEKTGIDKLQGRAFEFLEVLKFDREAAEKWRFDLEAKTTHFFNPGDPADIKILKNGEVIREIQAKSRDSAAHAIFDHSHPKYSGMGRLNPLDKFKKIKDLLDERLSNAPHDQLYRERYEDVRNNLMQSTNYENVASPGTTTNEARFAVENPELTKLIYDGEAIMKELGSNIAEGAVISGGTTVVIKVLLNTAKSIRGKKGLSESISDTLACTSSAAIRGGSVAGVSEGIRMITRSSTMEGVKSLAQSAAPIAIANTIFEMGSSIRKYVNGKISKNELKEECGASAMKGVATFYCGMVGQALIPIPVAGALAGSVVGYLTSSMLLQAGILGVGPRNIVEVSRKRREFIEQECMKTIEVMRYFKNQFDDLRNKYNYEFVNVLIPQIQKIEDSLISGSAVEIIKNLGFLNFNFNKNMQFRSFEEFDKFMNDPNTKLQL